MIDLRFLNAKYLAVGIAVMLPGIAVAANSTTTFEVSATVADHCDVSATNLAFGSITPVTNTNNDITSTVTVTCSNGTSYNVGLNTGLNASGSTRRMSDGGATPNYLTYEMYSNSGRTSIWGNTVGTDTVAGTGNGTDQALTVYGRVPSGQQTVPTGSYTDTVTVTVTF